MFKAICENGQAEESALICDLLGYSKMRQVGLNRSGVDCMRHQTALLTTRPYCRKIMHKTIISAN